MDTEKDLSKMTDEELDAYLASLEAGAAPVIEGLPPSQRPEPVVDSPPMPESPILSGLGMPTSIPASTQEQRDTEGRMLETGMKDYAYPAAKELAIGAASTMIPAGLGGLLGRAATKFAPETAGAVAKFGSDLFGRGLAGRGLAWGVDTAAQSEVENLLRQGTGENSSFLGTFGANAAGEAVTRGAFKLAPDLQITFPKNKVDEATSGMMRASAAASAVSPGGNQATADAVKYLTPSPRTGRSVADNMYRSGIDQPAADGMLMNPKLGRFEKATEAQLDGLVKSGAISPADKMDIMTYQATSRSSGVYNIKSRAPKARIAKNLLTREADERAARLDSAWNSMNAESTTRLDGVSGNAVLKSTSGKDLIQQLEEKLSAGSFGDNESLGLWSAISEMKNHFVTKGSGGATALDFDPISTATGRSKVQMDVEQFKKAWESRPPGATAQDLISLPAELSPTEALRLKRAIDAALEHEGRFEQKNLISEFRGNGASSADASATREARIAALQQMQASLAKELDFVDDAISLAAANRGDIIGGPKLRELDELNAMAAQVELEGGRQLGSATGYGSVEANLVTPPERPGMVGKAMDATMGPETRMSSEAADEFYKKMRQSDHINSVEEFKNRWSGAKQNPDTGRWEGGYRDLLPNTLAPSRAIGSSIIHNWGSNKPPAQATPNPELQSAIEMRDKYANAPMPEDSTLMDAAGGSGSGGGGGGGNFDDGMPPLTNDQAPLEQAMQQAPAPQAPMWMSQTPDGRLMDKNEQAMLLQDLKSRKDQGQIDEGMYYMQMNEFAPGGTMKILPEEQPQQVGKKVRPEDFMMELREGSRARPRLSQ